MAKQLYLFYGEEDFLIEARINELKKKFPETEKFDGSEPPLEALTSALQTTSLFVQEKLVIVYDVDPADELWDKLCPALKNISPGVAVVFVSSKAARRSKLFKTIEQLGETYEFKAYAEWEEDQVVSWVNQQVKIRGKVIEQQAARDLVDICGTSLRKLSSEIEKLITYAGERRELSVRDVEALASPGEISIFALLEAVAAKNLPQALIAFKTLQANKFELPKMLGLLAGQFRTMLMVKSVRDQGEAARILGANPYYVKKTAERAGRFSILEIKEKMRSLLDADLKLKSGYDQGAIVELLLASLAAQ